MKWIQIYYKFLVESSFIFRSHWIDLIILFCFMWELELANYRNRPRLGFIWCFQTRPANREGKCVMTDRYCWFRYVLERIFSSTVACMRQILCKIRFLMRYDLQSWEARVWKTKVCPEAYPEFRFSQYDGRAWQRSKKTWKTMKKVLRSVETEDIRFKRRTFSIQGRALASPCIRLRVCTFL